MSRPLFSLALLLLSSAWLASCTSTASVGDLFGSGGAKVADDNEDQKEAAVRRGSPPSPNSLLNQDKNEVLARLGQPTLLREELDSQMWQYSGRSCAFFLYLYPDAGGTFRVTHLEARANQGGSLDPQTCLESQWGRKAKS